MGGDTLTKENKMDYPIDKADAILEEWTVQVIPTRGIVVWGHIYGDKKGRFDNGDYVRTSLIKSVDFDTGLAQTLNTLYILGKQGDYRINGTDVSQGLFL
jgi:hypothetical protein